MHGGNVEHNGEATRAEPGLIQLLARVAFRLPVSQIANSLAKITTDFSAISSPRTKQLLNYCLPDQNN